VDAGPISDAVAAADVTLVDAAPKDLQTCLGDARSVTLSGGLPYTEVRVGAAPSPNAGAFLVDYATTRSAIDLAAFAAPGPTATGCNPRTLGQSCTCADLDFFGAWGPVTLVTEALAPGHAGILGTGFLLRHAPMRLSPRPASRSSRRRAITRTIRRVGTRPFAARVWIPLP
jgi:hypothetical protein